MKMIPTITGVSLALVLLSSCTTPPQRQTLRSTSTLNPHRGEYSSKNTIDLVRDAPVVKEYTVRPYVHPEDPNVRMPGGSMFVVNRPGRWNTEPLTRNGIVVEPQYASVNENVKYRRQATQNRIAIEEAKQAERLAKDSYFRSKRRADELEGELQQVKGRLLILEGAPGYSSELPGE